MSSHRSLGGSLEGVGEGVGAGEAAAAGVACAGCGPAVGVAEGVGGEATAVSPGWSDIGSFLASRQLDTLGVFGARLVNDWSNWATAGEAHDGPTGSQKNFRLWTLTDGH